MANANAPSYTPEIDGGIVTPEEWNDVRSRLAALITPITQVVSAPGAATILDTTDIVVITANGNVALVMPTAYRGRSVVVKNENTGGHTITVSAPGHTVQDGTTITAGGESLQACAWQWIHDGTTTWRRTALPAQQGPQGPAGATGPQGPAGANGADYTISLQTSAATSGYTMPAGTTVMEFTAPSGAITANLPATTPAPGAAGSIIQVAMPTNNAGGLTLVAPAGTTIQGASSFLLPASDAAPSTTADRGWQLRVVAPNTWRVL